MNCLSTSDEHLRAVLEFFGLKRLITQVDTTLRKILEEAFVCGRAARWDAQVVCASLCVEDICNTARELLDAEARATEGDYFAVRFTITGASEARYFLQSHSVETDIASADGSTALAWCYIATPGLLRAPVVIESNAWP